MSAPDAHFPRQTLQDKLDHIFTLKRAGRVNPAIRPEYYALLERLGNPHLKLPPVIHVAGTNGKGSTIAFLRAILEASGCKVHVYTSPHLIRFNERIVIAGREIGNIELERLLDEVMSANGGMEQTFFEIATVLALTAFARTPADVVLLETGLGGRLDSTNVIEKPLVTVITTLSYDHMEFLGGTIKEIAGEKAGILKVQTPCVVAHQIHPETLDVIEAKASELDAPLYGENDGWKICIDSPNGTFSMITANRNLENLPSPSLLGAHQIRNAATAVATLLVQDRFQIQETAFHEGLRSAVWPARLQKIDSIPLPSGWELWLDGGHNDSAAAVLADQVRAWAMQDEKPLHIVTGMLGHKDAASFARPLATLAESVTCISLENGYSPAELANVWIAEGARNVRVEQEWCKEIFSRIARKENKGRILITGSLYLAETISCIKT